MADGPRYRVHFRRRRAGKTDYRYRLKLLKSGLPRAAVRITNKRVIVAIENFKATGDEVIAMAESRELPAIGFGEKSLTSTPAAYLTGYLAGLRSVSAGAGEVVLDGGLTHPTPKGRVMGALKGLIDAGVEVPHSEEHLPSPDRLNGKHLKQLPPDTVKNIVGKLKQHVERPARKGG